MANVKDFTGAVPVDTTAEVTPVTRQKIEQVTPAAPRSFSPSTTSALIARMALDSLVNTFAGPTILYIPSEFSNDGSMAVLLITDPSGARFP